MHLQSVTGAGKHGHFMRKADALRRKANEVEAKIIELKNVLKDYPNSTAAPQIRKDLEFYRRERRTIIDDMNRALYNAGRA